MQTSELTQTNEIEHTLCTGPHAVTLTETGMIIPEDMTYDEWYNGLKSFKWMQTKLALGFADYLSFGRRKFGHEVVHGMIAQLEFDLPTVTIADIVSNVPSELRLPNLSAEHYAVLVKAGLKAQLREKWAKIASEQELTPTQLRVSIIAGEVVSSTVARQQVHGITSIHGIRMEFDIWMKRVGGLEGIKGMDPEAQHEIAGEIETIVALWEALLGRAQVEAPKSMRTGPIKKGKKAVKKAVKKTVKKPAAKQ